LYRRTTLPEGAALKYGPAATRVWLDTITSCRQTSTAHPAPTHELLDARSAGQKKESVRSE